jgi:hypothetical protein
MSKGEETRAAVLDEVLRSGLFGHFRSKEQLQLDPVVAFLSTDQAAAGGAGVVQERMQG